MIRTTLLVIAGALLSATAHAGARQNAMTVMPDNADHRCVMEEWGHSEATVAGDTIFSMEPVAIPALA